MAKKDSRMRIKEYGKWRQVTDMDRFITIVFLTAEEKFAFAEKNFGLRGVDYVDGKDIEKIELTDIVKAEMAEAWREREAKGATD